MLSPAKICMNGLCGATTSSQWKRGWPMKVGGFATLCYSCGTEYDNVRYCERFHLNESGWRECDICEKPIHCGCVVAKYHHEYLDTGGISCMKCIRANGNQPLKQSNINKIPNGFTRFSGNWHPSVFTNRTNSATSLTEPLDKSLNSSREFGTRCSSNKDIGSSFKNPLPLPSIFSTQLPVLTDNNKPNFWSKSVYEQEKIPSFKNEQKPRQMVLKPLKSDNRVAKQPAEGRGRSQLLPRYWPKITNQELLQISGELNSNCTITPLFEKVLSASDAGRIGRLVLPKACAEAYFPTITQSEGVPIKIRDIKGKEWTFQFRFWPNNNSRMYVLEGVTPCIQNMQLQAGDTVIFSRIDPEDKLIIGCRKLTIPVEASALPNTVNGGDLICTGNGNSPSNMEHEGTGNSEALQQSIIEERKKTRNIGSKSKRLHMHSEDVMKLQFTWDEAQDFLRPPLSKPTVVVIENCEFEEYDEPPVFGKKTIFTMNQSRLQEQWVQCDSCSKWRKLPLDVLIPSKWTCSDNISDPNRCSCSAAEERGIGDLDRILRYGKEFKKRKITKNPVTQEQKPEPTGLDALATVAVLDNGDSLVGPTTRHPRHRPGCTCIVCIQPPSGKGKHKPNCICNVCSTVRRRFKTLMLRKKKRLSEHEGETVNKHLIDGPETMNENSNNNNNNNNNKGEELDLNCDPKEEEIEEMMLAVPPELENVLQGPVPNGTSDIEDGCVKTSNRSLKAVDIGL